MNPVPSTLNSLVRQRPLVYSLHDQTGQAVAVFASSEPMTITQMLGEWTKHFDQGCVGIVWKHGHPDRALGKGDL